MHVGEGFKAPRIDCGARRSEIALDSSRQGMIHSDAAETSRCATHPERASVRSEGQGASSIGLRKKRTPLSKRKHITTCSTIARIAARAYHSRGEDRIAARDVFWCECCDDFALRLSACRSCGLRRRWPMSICRRLARGSARHRSSKKARTAALGTFKYMTELCPRDLRRVFELESSGNRWCRTCFLTASTPTGVRHRRRQALESTTVTRRCSLRKRRDLTREPHLELARLLPNLSTIFCAIGHQGVQKFREPRYNPAGKLRLRSGVTCNDLMGDGNGRMGRSSSIRKVDPSRGPCGDDVSDLLRRSPSLLEMYAHRGLANIVGHRNQKSSRSSCRSARRRKAVPYP